jgi:hypothetical protein
MGQSGFFEAVARANSHLRYWKYRRDLGSPISISLAVRQWFRRMAFEWLGIGHGA